VTNDFVASHVDWNLFACVLLQVAMAQDPVTDF
jgi:hypothetical protein